MKNFFKQFTKLKNDKKGSVMIFVLIFGSAAFTMIVAGLASYAILENRASNRIYKRDQAFHIAESGINYYRWHLAHAPTDYQDGTGQPGPYVHPYLDKDGDTVGYFSLQIQPPLSGTTVVMVSSTGWTVGKPDEKRTIQVRMGFPALTDYAFVSNSNMSFSFTSTVNGQTHSNGGIKFDGTATSWVRSAKDSYEYQPGQWRNGVWGGANAETRAFWEFPVPSVDFFGVTADLSALRTMAVDAGVLLTSSGQEGWHFVFNGSTYDLYRVTSRDCYYGSGRWRYRFWVGWYWDGDIYCYDIGNETLVSSGNPIPANGAIFVEDDVWVEGNVDGRLSLAAGEIPVQQPYKNIFVTGNLTYAQRNDDDVTGLFTQGDIIIPYEVPDQMTIEAAMLSQFGAIHRPFYSGQTRTSLTVYGSQIDYLPGGMKWVNGWGHVISGFIDTLYIYDGNLRYLPPPGFPVGNTYELISWEELE